MSGEYLNVLVKANSKKSEIISQEGDTIKVAVKALPEKGKANAELIRFLSKHFGKQVRIVSGFSSKRKKVMIYL